MDEVSEALKEVLEEVPQKRNLMVAFMVRRS
jgi:hypothetical protein